MAVIDLWFPSSRQDILTEVLSPSPDGTGNHFRYIPVQEIARSLGPDKSQALPIVHAYMGCDTVSSFHTRSKRSVWDTWKTFDGVTATFLALSTGPVEGNDDHVASLEQFTILPYDCTSNVVNIWSMSSAVHIQRRASKKMCRKMQIQESSTEVHRFVSLCETLRLIIRTPALILIFPVIVEVC